MDPCALQVTPYKIPKKKTSYVPVPDGFITTDGNKELGQKYGNHVGPATNNLHKTTQ